MAKFWRKSSVRVTLSIMSTRQKINGVSVPLPTDQRWGINLHFTDYFPDVHLLCFAVWPWQMDTPMARQTEIVNCNYLGEKPCWT